MTTNILNISRRGFVSASIAGTAALALGGRGLAADATKLKVGFISPRTGPLAGFGQTDGYVLEKVRETLAKGVTLGGKAYAWTFSTATRSPIPRAPASSPRI